MWVSQDRARFLSTDGMLSAAGDFRDVVMADGFRPNTPEYVNEIARRLKEAFDAGTLTGEYFDGTNQSEESSASMRDAG